MSEKEPLLQVRHLKKYYTSGGNFGKKSVVRAVDDVSFDLYAGETLAIVGESGCGKSTTVKSLIRITEPTGGQVILHGQDFLKLRGKQLYEARKSIRMIFQDPYSSLDPRMTVRDLIAEPLDISHTVHDPAQREQIVLDTMKQCGLDPTFIDRYAHEFSGGQRQRIGIARAIIMKPEIVICDEPVSALDVSVQAKIINLLRQLQKDLGMSYIFISHDLGVVSHIADRVLIMYLGKVMEQGTKEEIFSDPVHPYTRALLESVPRIGGDKLQIENGGIEGDVPSPANPPSGCVFHTRCPFATEACAEKAPQLSLLSGKHSAACWHMQRGEIK